MPNEHNMSKLCNLFLTTESWEKSQLDLKTFWWYLSMPSAPLASKGKWNVPKLCFLRCHFLGQILGLMCFATQKADVLLHKRTFMSNFIFIWFAFHLRFLFVFLALCARLLSFVVLGSESAFVTCRKLLFSFYAINYDLLLLNGIVETWKRVTNH